MSHALSVSVSPVENALDRSNVLAIDAEAAADDIAAKMHEVVVETLRRRGVVVRLNGGIGSSATAGLAVRAFGRDRVIGVVTPEPVDGADDSARIDEATLVSCAVAKTLGIDYVIEEVTPVLRAFGAYARRDKAIRTVMPGYGRGWRSKVVLADLLDGGALRFHTVVASDPNGTVYTQRLSQAAYLELRAATNCKQRAEAMIEYFHADRLHYAVAGTADRLENDLGFFVKGGEGLADLKPIAHLYKSQVYALARAVRVPEEVLSRRPASDRYPLSQGQDDFYFSLPYELLDLCLWAKDHGVAAAEAAPRLGLRTSQVERIFMDIEEKRSATRPLHLPSLLVEPVPELSPAR